MEAIFTEEVKAKAIQGLLKEIAQKYDYAVVITLTERERYRSPEDELQELEGDVVGGAKTGKAATRDPRQHKTGSAFHQATSKTFEDTMAEWCRLDKDSSPSPSPSSKSSSASSSSSSRIPDLNRAIKEEPSQAGPIRARMEKRKAPTTPPGILKRPTAPNGFKIHESA